MPTYIVAYCYVELLDYSGPVQQALRALFGWRSARDYWFPEIRTLGGCVLVLASVLYPYVYLLARSAFLEQQIYGRKNDQAVEYYEEQLLTVRSTVDSLVYELGVAPEAAPLGDHELAPVFLPGRAAGVTAGDRAIGVIGEVHPEVIVAFGLDHPVVLAELDLTAFEKELGS